MGTRKFIPPAPTWWELSTNWVFLLAVMTFMMFAISIVLLCFVTTYKIPPEKKIDPSTVRAHDVETPNARRRDKEGESTLRQRRGQRKPTSLSSDKISSHSYDSFSSPTSYYDMFSTPKTNFDKMPSETFESERAELSWRTEKTIDEEKELEAEATVLWDDYMAARSVEEKYQCVEKISQRLATIKNTYKDSHQAIFVTQRIIFCNVLMSCDGLGKLQECKSLGDKKLADLANCVIEDVVPVIWS